MTKIRELKSLNKLPNLNNEGCKYAITYAITTTGISGRFEKKPFSKVELLVYHTGGIHGVRILESSLKYDRPFCQLGEVKNIETDSTLTYNNARNRIFPTRTLDAILIDSDNDI